MQADPIGYGDGMNWYNYVHGDPVNGRDPSGTDCMEGSVCRAGDSPTQGSGCHDGCDSSDYTNGDYSPLLYSVTVSGMNGGGSGTFYTSDRRFGNFLGGADSAMWINTTFADHGSASLTAAFVLAGGLPVANFNLAEGSPYNSKVISVLENQHVRLILSTAWVLSNPDAQHMSDRREIGRWIYVKDAAYGEVVTDYGSHDRYLTNNDPLTVDSGEPMRGGYDWRIFFHTHPNIMGDASPSGGDLDDQQQKNYVGVILSR